MNRTLVMTLIGPDQPGLVGRVSNLVSECGGNWLESRMAHLGGQFAGIVKVSANQESARLLAERLDALKARDIHVVVASEDGDGEHPAPKTTPITTLEIVGNDRTGIVSAITSVLSRHHVNVEEFESTTESAPMSGESLFKATASLSLPDSCSIDQLQQDLEAIASDLMVDVSLGS